MPILVSEFVKRLYISDFSFKLIELRLKPVLLLPQVKVWFQNRRIKWRRQNLEREQARLAQLSRPLSPCRGSAPPSPCRESAPAAPLSPCRVAAPSASPSRSAASVSSAPQVRVRET